ncbi:divergent polysaccharide deacetylase family protein [Motiliproteus sp.]|uniref:divergent polysaccharide deacetylase family protein n=1 Tax=Motiliproteus sp. TaxID=1898955 RepID=UPI003BAA4762
MRRGLRALAAGIAAALALLLTVAPASGANRASTSEPHPAEVSDSVSQPALVIIIDDVGDNYARGRAAVELPGPVTYAFLPHSPFGPKLARKAFADGKDVILHAPMQNTRDRPLGPGALTADLGKQQFRQVLQGDLDVIPHVQGLNNHMGSLLTTLQPQMEWVMELARERGLFFIDSRTSASSIAWETARRYGIPNLKRDVFLDHERTTEFVHRQFMKALAIARRHGSAVVIGHPYPVTVDYLRLALPLLDEQGIRLLTASALIMEQQERLRLVSRPTSP